MEDDILYQGYVGEITDGSFVVFENIGAYSIVLKPPFILPSPPILVTQSQSGDYVLARRQETTQDVFRSYVRESSQATTQDQVRP